MKDEPNVSVIMGVHNDEEFVADAIDSILEQSYEDFEFIIVDDASTDDSRTIIERYTDERIILLENQTNQGLTPSLNRALREASGTFVARQDADDVSDPERFERQVRFLDRNPDVSVVGTAAYLIDESGSITSSRSVLRTPTFDDLLEKNHIIHGSIMARRSVLLDLDGYDEFFRYSQDLDLWLRLSKEFSIANITEPLYRLRIHDHSVYFAKKDQSALYTIFARHRATDKLSSEAEDEVRSNGIETYYDDLSKQAKAAFHQDLAVRYLRYGHLKPAREECRSALANDPRSILALILCVLSHSNRLVINSLLRVMRRWLNLKFRLKNKIDRNAPSGY